MGNTFSRCTQQHTSLYAQHHWYGRNPKDKDLLHQQFVGDYLPKNLRLLGRTWCDGVECWGAHGWIPSEMNREWGARIYFHRLLRRMKTKPYWRLKKKRCFAAKNVLEVLVETSFFQSSLLFPTFDFGCFFSHLLLFGLIKFRSVGHQRWQVRKLMEFGWMIWGCTRKKKTPPWPSPVRNAKLAVAVVLWVWVGVKWCFVQFYVYTLED